MRSTNFKATLVVFIALAMACNGAVKAIPNCSYAQDSICYDCDDGYSPSPNGAQCIKCPYPCILCSTNNVCKQCNAGYGVVKGGACGKCKAANCFTCAANLTTCTTCNFGFGSNGGKCTKCPQNVQSCNNGKNVCKQGAGTFGASRANPCKACADRNCAICNKSACDECDVSFSYVNGKCRLT